MILTEISKKGIDFICAFEGCSLTAYRDSGGVLTIGYGHTGDVKEGDKITKTQAVEMFKNDIKHYYPKDETKRERFDALTSYMYNCGVYAITKLSSRMNHIYDAKGNKLKGLIRRRIAELVLYNEGVYDTSMTPLTNALTRCSGLCQYGDNSYYTALIQQSIRIINNLGNEFTIDGIFGDCTLSEVKKLQGALGVRRDGVVGDITRNAIIKELTRRVY